MRAPLQKRRPKPTIMIPINLLAIVGLTCAAADSNSVRRFSTSWNALDPALANTSNGQPIPAGASCQALNPSDRHEQLGAFPRTSDPNLVSDAAHRGTHFDILSEPRAMI